MAFGQKSSDEANEAYRKGLCKVCLVKPYGAGRTMCNDCYKKRGQE